MPVGMELYFYDGGTSSVPTPEWKVGEKIRRRTSKCLKNYYNFIKRVEFFSVLRKQNSFGTVFEATMFGTVIRKLFNHLWQKLTRG
jgi:hypothetical protein